MANETPSDLITEQIKSLLDVRGITVKRLAAECAKAGLPQLTEQALYKLLGQRNAKDRRPRSVSVEELLTLARVLDVPPVRLILDVSKADVEILPGVHMDPWDALLWIGGENDPDVDWVRYHQGQVREWLELPDRFGLSGPARPPELGPDPMEHALDDGRKGIEKAIMRIRGTLRKRNIRPPALPPELSHIDGEI